MKEALFYKIEGDKIRCNLCPHRCLIPEGKTGICHQRENIEGRLRAAGYGKISAIGLDPIEKKPLYHFYPGSMILSVGGLWCNFRCCFCQNWRIAHQECETVEYTPEQLVDAALQNQSIGIAFTYNEPVIWYEYIYDTALAARDKGLKIVLVTNGFIEAEPLDHLLPHVDAMNIDVKAFNEEYYRKVCGGGLRRVMETVEKVAGNCHIEVTTLVVGGLNDDPLEMEGLFKWLQGINKDIPLHLSRYFPQFKMDKPSTPIDTLFKLRDNARNFLNYVYVGNVPGADSNTYCPRCGLKLVERGYHSRISGIENGRCVQCSQPISIIL